MSIIDRIFVGRIIKDFGTFDEKSIGIGKMRHSALLAEKHGRLFFVIKFRAWAIFGASVIYEKFAFEDAAKIRVLIDESEKIPRTLLQVDYDFKKLALRNMLVVLLI